MENEVNWTQKKKKKKNQTQISDLWFSFLPFRNHKHKHKLTPWRMRRTEPRKKKKKKKKNGEGELNPEKKMENEVEWGCVTLVAMGEEDERGRGLCDSARSVTTRTKQSWESREHVLDCSVYLRACGCVCCGLVAVCVRGLRDEEGEAEVWAEMRRE